MKVLWKVFSAPTATIDRVLQLEIIWYQTLENRVQSTTDVAERLTIVDDENLHGEKKQ